MDRFNMKPAPLTRATGWVFLQEMESTNTWTAAHADEFTAQTLVEARAQTRGRGQRGNGWEAEPGRNLTVSLLWRPEGCLRPTEQFAISEATALAVADCLANYRIAAKVKWPNDVYVGDRKIAGILIEHALYGMELRRSIIGIGLNVNQQEFLSDAPNPVSMRQIAGGDFQLAEVRLSLVTALEKRLGQAATPEGRKRLHEEFLGMLWRGDGALHPFALPDGSRFRARIAGVEPEGLLVLHPQDNSGPLRFAFKEVVFLL